MNIYITKAGGKWLAIGGGIVLSLLVIRSVAWIFTAIENSRVGGVPAIEDFQPSDIHYTDMASLRESLTQRYHDIEKGISELQALQKRYPENLEIMHKLESYQKNMSSLKSSFFLCPEHITESCQTVEKRCEECNGKGKTYWMFKCEACNGTGKKTESEVNHIACPHCGSEGEAALIPASRLLP